MTLLPKHYLFFWVVLALSVYSTQGRARGGRGRVRKRNFFRDVTFTTIDTVCPVESDIVSCQLRSDDDDEENGAYVCRTKTHRDGTNVTLPLCAPVDKILEDDECGCCGGECPEICTACVCEKETGRGSRSRTMEGVEVVTTDGDVECVLPFQSRYMVAKGDAVCNTECVFSA